MSGEAVHGFERPVRKKNALLKMLPIVALAALVGGAGLWAMNKLSSISTVSVDYGDGSVSTVTRTAPSKPSDAEEAMYRKAAESQLKTEYQDYLRSYPEGHYARKIREQVLTLCKGEMRPVWEAMEPFGQWQRAVSDHEAPNGDPVKWSNQTAACENAKSNFKTQVDAQCRNIASASRGRNIELNIEWVDCECKFVVDSWWCQNDSTYACSFEREMDKYVEICG